MEPASAAYAAFQAARSLRQAQRALDAYAAEQDVTRAEAVRLLSKEASRRGDLAVRKLADDYVAQVAWQRRHPVATVFVRAADPTGMGRVGTRAARRWLRDRP